jgi:glyoxylase I family protein
MKITGIHHIELTVKNMEISKAFYSKIPDFKIVADYPGLIMFSVGNFYLGLTNHLEKVETDRFNEKNIGLDHFAIEVDSMESLNEAKDFLQQEGIIHGEIIRLSNGTHVLSFRDPDNIQIEFAYKE